MHGSMKRSAHGPESRGDFLSEKYQGATGSSKEACELFVEAEDLLGQEQFDTLEIPVMFFVSFCEEVIRADAFWAPHLGDARG